VRTACGVTLETARLTLAAVHINVRAAQAPPPEANGISRLKIPVKALWPRKPLGSPGCSSDHCSSPGVLHRSPHLNLWMVITVTSPINEGDW